MSLTSTPKYDITITEGADFTLSLVLEEDREPMVLTGYTAQAQLRESYDQGAALIREFRADIINPPSGELILSLTSAQTMALFPVAHPQRPRTLAGYYDVFITSPTGTVTYLLGGRVIYFQTITRS
ncbi:hypothetical protein [Oceanisphaera arctica]|uniref:Uncharacterized protein n=1 Tax=Oceanisphaera arctica TaxID=641510 RepID=A0A2P5TMX3_9GAMM|nr:hypothetical protein [Oceanisphaera arctica]PPL16818.1 hypothetical protein UN63_07815 [Oceanisphaera arctica]GHA05522.1 hypothetical protein GCM10007082_03090 [Oceanisphaera arctica]